MAASARRAPPPRFAEDNLAPHTRGMCRCGCRGLAAGGAAAVAGDYRRADHGRAGPQPGRQPGYLHGIVGTILHRCGVRQFGPGHSRTGHRVGWSVSLATCEAMTMADGAGRKLVLMRHAKSAWPDVPDHERPLARRGQRDAPVMGRWLRAAGHVPDQVLCSTARRARETWQLAQAGLGATPPVSFDDGVYQALGSAASGPDPPRASGGEDAADRGPRSRNPGARAQPDGDHFACPRGRRERRRTGCHARPHASQVPHRRHRGLGVRRNWDQLGPGTARLTCFVTPRDLPGKA